ncbi:MAG: response regulator transcription factor [Candidatus Competibacter sp.]|nr:response regulator transcription factor [Candidatus Competibacter sp.]
MKILLADDHEVVRRGLKQMLAEEFGNVAFGEAGTTAEALERIRQEPWDLIVLDINMPGRSGLEVLAELSVRRIKSRVLVLSMAPEEEYAVRAFKKGAAGYLTKQTVATELVVAVKKILAGGRYVTPWLAEKLASGLGSPAAVEPHDQLSDRELQVLRMIATGMSVKDIADELSLSDKTVFTYRDRLREKLGLKGDVELARYALRHRLVE